MIACSFFGIGTGVHRHSAGCVGSLYICAYMVRTFAMRIRNTSREFCHSCTQSIYTTDRVGQKWL